jgi:hypothetical protein
MRSSLQTQRDIARPDSAHHERMLDSMLKALELLCPADGPKGLPHTGLYLLGAAPHSSELKTNKAIPPWRCTPPWPDWTSSRTLERGGAGIRPRRRRHHHTKGFPAYQHVQRRARGRELSASLSVLRRPGCALSRSRGRG